MPTEEGGNRRKLREGKGISQGGHKVTPVVQTLHCLVNAGSCREKRVEGGKQTCFCDFCSVCTNLAYTIYIAQFTFDCK